LHEINACTGGGGVPLSDSNDDGVIDADDLTDANSDGVIDSNDLAGGLLDGSDFVEYPDPDNPDQIILMIPGMEPQFDINNDGKIDLNDMIRIDTSDPSKPLAVAPTGITYPEMIYAPPPPVRNPDGTETKYFSTSSGNIEMLREQGEKRGIFYWRCIE
jgi:hypothetical protein